MKKSWAMLRELEFRSMNDRTFPSAMKFLMMLREVDAEEEV